MVKAPDKVVAVKPVAKPAKAAPKEEKSLAAMVTKKLVQLPKPYGGVPSNGEIIPAGTFLEDDPIWKDLADYLVRTRHAFIVGETEVAELPPPEDELEEGEEEPEEEPVEETPKA